MQNNYQNGFLFQNIENSKESDSPEKDEAMEVPTNSVSPGLDTSNNSASQSVDHAQPSSSTSTEITNETNEETAAVSQAENQVTDSVVCEAGVEETGIFDFCNFNLYLICQF